MLGELLGGAVQQADVRIGALDHLAVELQHQAQHAVRGRMLRAKVQGVVVDFSHDLGRPITQFLVPAYVPVALLAHDARRHLARLDRHRLVNHALLVGS